MNIVVCIKWVISTDSAISVEHGVIKDRGVYHVVNPYDLIAVEEAVRLGELYRGGEITLVCLGPSSAEDGLRRCFAIGADKGIILWDTAFEGSDSYATALVLAKAISRLRYDIILCGQKATDTEAGEVGATLAEFLNIPMISSAIKIGLSSDCKKVTIHRKLEKGNRELVETNLPALITVETGLNKPRYPNLRAILAAQRKEIRGYNLKTLALSYEEVGFKGSKTRVIALSLPKPRPKKPFTPDSSLSAAERMRLIMAGGVTQKQANLLEGEPEYIASNIVRFLSEQKLIPE